MIKLFTHTDLDGIGCAILAKIAFGDDVKIEYCDYDNVNEKVSDFFIRGNAGECDKVFITDISINDDLARTINDYAIDDLWYLLDHHPTALALNKYFWCSVSIEYEDKTLGVIKTSGTELFYYWLTERKYLKKSDTLQRFVELVRDYDTWRWNEIGEKGVICKQVNDLLYLYGRDDFILWCISEIYDNTFPRLDAKDEFILKIKQSEIDKYIEEKNQTLYKTEMCDRTCGLVFADRYLSELGNKLCKLNPDIDYVAMINIDDCKVGYRTIKDDIDLGKDIASLFGGGGHPKAAGSEFTKEIKLKVIEEIFK